jgi:hypothetical protein
LVESEPVETDVSEFYVRLLIQTRSLRLCVHEQVISQQWDQPLRLMPSRARVKLYRAKPRVSDPHETTVSLLDDVEREKTAV